MFELHNMTTGWLGAAWFERFYRDGNPAFNIGRNNRPAPTAHHAQVEAKRAIKRLRKVAKRDSEGAPAMVALAEQIEACRRGQRCHSGACPSCQRAIQRWLVWTLSGLQRRLGEPLGLLSLIPATAITIRDPASSDHVRRTKNEFITNASAVGLSLAVGGFDFSYNEHAATEFEPYLQPHFWLAVRLSELNNCRKALDDKYPKSPTIDAPTMVKPWNGDLRAFAYAMKWCFARRVTLPRKRHELGMAPGRQDTRDRPLRLAQQVHLAGLMHDLGLRDRLILHGVQVTPNARGRPSIRPAQPSEQY